MISWDVDRRSGDQNICSQVLHCFGETRATMIWEQPLSQRGLA